jgi:site-specific DNA-methyltransferase (adenine-specific)
VAQRLERVWIGIDITHLSINVIKSRLRDQFGPDIDSQYEVIGEPRDVEGAINLAKGNRYQFQWWALSLISARPYQDKKKGSDTGIDGYIYFMDEKDKEKSAIVSVKSGKVGVQQIRDLCHVVEREKAEFGLFITIDAPTDPMMKEGLRQGVYKDPTGKTFPRIQIRTIEQLLSGDGFALPSILPTYRKARSYREKNANLEIL